MNDINKMLSKMTTTKEVENMAGRTLNMVQYGELNNYNNFIELFNENKYILLYIPMNNNAGHWIALYFNPKKWTVYIFNSYGVEIDEDNKYSQYYIFPELSKMIIDDKLKLKFEYFNYPFQKHSKDVQINTCGRWCSIFFRYFNNFDSVDDFINTFKKIEKKFKPIYKVPYTLDIIACLLTNKYII